MNNNRPQYITLVLKKSIGLQTYKYQHNNHKTIIAELMKLQEGQSQLKKHPIIRKYKFKSINYLLIKYHINHPLNSYINVIFYKCFRATFLQMKNIIDNLYIDLY